MAFDPVVDIANYLDANSTSITLNTNMFYGPVRANSTLVPVEAVFVNTAGGSPPLRTLGTTTEVRQPRVRIVVRSSGFASGLSLSRGIYTKLQSASPSTGEDYMDVQAVQSEPVFIEQDKNMHCFWMQDFLCRYQSS